MNQINIFIRAFLTGIIIGALSDLLEVMRAVFKRKRILCNVADAIFGVLSGVAGWIFLYSTDNGGFRAYMVIGILLGVVWKKQLKKLFKKATIKWRDHRKFEEGQ